MLITNSGGTQEIKPISAVIRKEGTRTVDTAEIVLPAQANVNENDKIKYIQDIGDVSNLTAVYNFQGTTKDEGGYGLDGDDSFDDVVSPNDSKTSGNNTYANTDVKATRNRMNYGIIYHGTKTTISHDSKLDFAKQFDIICTASLRTISPSGASVGDKKIFYSKIDSSGNGIELGVVLKQQTHLYGGTDSEWSGYARVRYNSIEREYKQDWSYTSGNAAVNKPIAQKGFTLRLWREYDNKIRFSFNGLEKGSWFNGSTSLDSLTLDTTNTGSSSSPKPPHTLATTNDIWLGQGRDGSNNADNDWDGIAYQLKIYTGGYLDGSDAEVLMMSTSTPTTIKFSGTVFRVDDKTKSKSLSCKGDGNVILNHTFNSAQFSNSVPADSSYVTRVSVGGAKKNLYPATTTTNIIKSLLNLADSSFGIIDTDYTSHTLQGQYVAEGSFLANVRTVLNGLSQTAFWSNGVKTFFLEDNDGIETGLTFKSGQGEEKRGVRILAMGKSDNYLVNDVELVGRQFLKHDYGTLSSVSNGTTTTLNHFPVNLRITHGGTDNIPLTQDTNYTVNYDERKVTFLGSGTDVKIEYDYEDRSTNTGNSYTTSDSTSINTYGKRTRRYFVPQLAKWQDLQRLGQYLIINNKETIQRYQIELPYLANNLRENHKITITNRKGTAGVIVKQITWYYPEGKTIIQAGENLIDGFDLDQVDSLSTASAVSSIQKSKV